MNDVRARFLKSILEQLPAERIVELHFFTPIRQGHIETGVAVIAAEPERPAPVAEDTPDVEEAFGVESGHDDSPYAELPGASGGAAAADAPSAESPATPRFEVLTAVYRWTRKGSERGKWDVDVTAEADAPLPTVGTVVQGVQDRAGEELEPLRLTHAQLQALLGEPSWPTTP